MASGFADARPFWIALAIVTVLAAVAAVSLARWAIAALTAGAAVLVALAVREAGAALSDGTPFVSVGPGAGLVLSLAGVLALPAAALRSSGLELYGSGGGSIPHTAIFEAFPQVLKLAACGKLRIDTEPVALADVEQAWQRHDSNGRRRVIVP